MASCRPRSLQRGLVQTVGNLCMGRQRAAILRILQEAIGQGLRVLSHWSGPAAESSSLRLGCPSVGLCEIDNFEIPVEEVPDPVSLPLCKDPFPSLDIVALVVGAIVCFVGWCFGSRSRAMAVAAFMDRVGAVSADWKDIVIGETAVTLGIKVLGHGMNVSPCGEELVCVVYPDAGCGPL